jgi:3'(2'), 5'-bisphosphate nucleotidase
MDDAALLDALEKLALAAGPVVMDAFVGGCAVERKGDDSPVTIADRESERIILEGLRRILPQTPIVAEEAAAAGDFPADPGREFLLVDPLDGTREFIEGRPEFTVNIALVRDGTPALGVVYAPASGVLYSGRPGHAQKAQVADDFTIAARQHISARARPVIPVVVASRSHRSAETDAYIATLPQAEIVSIGSSLKFGLLAAGQADLYPRFGPTMQWDTAAGDAVLRAAGGSTTTQDGAPLRYGPRRDAMLGIFMNPPFIAQGA